MLKAEMESVQKPQTGGKFSMAGALRLAQKIEKRAERKNASEKEGEFLGNHNAELFYLSLDQSFLCQPQPTFRSSRQLIKYFFRSK